VLGLLIARRHECLNCRRAYNIEISRNLVDIGARQRRWVVTCVNRLVALRELASFPASPGWARSFSCLCGVDAFEQFKAETQESRSLGIRLHEELIRPSRNAEVVITDRIALRATRLPLQGYRNSWWPWFSVPLKPSVGW
jgi:hypothetical protein